MQKILTLFIALLLVAAPAHAQKISALPAGAPAQAADLIPISNLARSTTQSYTLQVSDILGSGLPATLRRCSG